MNYNNSFCFLVIRGLIFSAVIFPELKSTSAKTNFPPNKEALLAVATKDLGVVIISSPFFIPIAKYAG